jgi:hypothetical protein
METILRFSDYYDRQMAPNGNRAYLVCEGEIPFMHREGMLYAMMTDCFVAVPGKVYSGLVEVIIGDGLIVLSLIK